MSEQSNWALDAIRYELAIGAREEAFKRLETAGYVCDLAREIVQVPGSRLFFVPVDLNGGTKVYTYHRNRPYSLNLSGRLMEGTYGLIPSAKDPTRERVTRMGANLFGRIRRGISCSRCLDEGLPFGQGPECTTCPLELSCLVNMEVL